MVIRKHPSKPHIDISGPAGNAFALLGQAQVLAQQLGLDHEAILEEMQASDYEHLIQVFNKHFGMYVDLVR